MKSHYQATADKVIAVFPLEATSEAIGGIIMPPNFDKRKLEKKSIAEATAHSVGPDCKTVKVGDRFLFNQHGYKPYLPCDDGELLQIPESSIIAVVTPVPEPVAAPAGGSPIPESEKPLTVEAIRAGLAQQERGGLLETPAEPPSADAQLAQKTT